MAALDDGGLNLGGRRLRILYSFPNRIGITGIGMTAWHQVSSLVEVGHSVVVACGSCERSLPDSCEVVDTTSVLGIRLPYRLFGRDRVYRYHDGTVARLLSSRAADFDVFHGWPLGSLKTLQVARQRNVPTVLERPNAHTGFAYEAVAREHFSLNVPVPRDHTHRYNAKRLEREESEYALADQLACPSDFVRQTFLSRGFDESSLGRHAYGFDKSKFYPGDRSDRGNGGITALFAGRCEPRKGLHYALRAWLASGLEEKGQFLIAGEFIPHYRERLGPLLDHPSVRVLGFVADVATLMRQADVFVLPSVEEGSALVTYEARACGCVLLVSDSTGAEVRHGIDGFVHRAGDVEELTAQFRQLGESSERFRAMRAASCAASNGNSWTDAAALLTSVYRNAIDRARSRGSLEMIRQ